MVAHFSPPVGGINEGAVGLYTAMDALGMSVTFDRSFGKKGVTCVREALPLLLQSEEVLSHHQPTKRLSSQVEGFRALAVTDIIGYDQSANVGYETFLQFARNYSVIGLGYSLGTNARGS